MRCLIQFSQDSHWVNFRFAELDSLLCMNGIDPATAYSKTDVTEAEIAFLCVELPDSEVLRAICERSVLIKAIYELWCNAPTVADLIQGTKNLDSSFLKPYLSDDKSWSINVDTHCKTYSMGDKERCRNHFKFLNFQGKVNLSEGADVQLWILLNYYDEKDNVYMYMYVCMYI
jgi:tRNA (guanine10-N2)-methyltransferase